MEMIFEILFVGAFATIVIDIWALILKRVFNLPVTNWGMVGRWFWYMTKGQFIHRPIKDAPEVRYEHAIGWVMHYLIGIIYAHVYLVVVKHPTLTSAMVFGLMTIVFPWFVLLPGLGLGAIARCAPKPNVIRAINISIHSIFGASLYVGWVAALSVLNMFVSEL